MEIKSRVFRTFGQEMEPTLYTGINALNQLLTKTDIRS